MTSDSTLIRNRQYYAFEGIAERRFVCAFSPRSAGNMSLFYADTKNALDNRKLFLEAMGIDYRNLVCGQQVHACGVRYAEKQDRGRGSLYYLDAIPSVDAFITDRFGLPLAIFTADCLPVFLCDPRTPAIGIAHAGWRGSRENIVGKTVAHMQKTFSTRAEDLLIGLGPAVRKCCYAVGAEFNGLFPADIIKNDNLYFLDLVNINKKQLLGAGIKEGNIFDSGICTVCNNGEFFSHRKEGNACGRTISVAMLKRKG